MCMQSDAVGPPNKGHIGDNVNSAVSSFIVRLSSFNLEVLNARGKVTFGTSSNVHYREAYCTVSLLQRVHY